MSLQMNQRITDLGISGIRVFSNKLVNYPDALNLTIGQPDFAAPQAVKEAAAQSILNDQTGYSSNAGLLELREAVATFFEDKYQCHYNPQTEIMVTNGASQALDAVLRTILLPGDELIIPAPMYAGYVPVIDSLGAKAVYLDTTDTQFQPSVERLKELITPNTKAVMFNYPTNPTGAIIAHDVMDEIVEFLKDQDVYIISDEIYSENTFEHEHRSFGYYPEIKDRLFLIHGLSKSHAMTGYRIGFLMGHERLIAHTVKVSAFNILCASVPSQYGAIAALTVAKDTPADMNKDYIDRRDYVYGRLIEMGFDVQKPQGAFYIFPSITKFGMTSEEFATRLMEEGGVGVVPGSAFSKIGEGYIRITYAYAMDTLIVAMDRMATFLKKII
ncbi:aminotransferase class I/II-fold pyridoxal phosphate-dependent enzyme [Kurthia sibirica]|uniref:Aminotransferase n=1 Tax=Kurthia sibirica TaxID=202750 RepID=A0A2U3AL27_9BACL|nr:aminotransferase class I/II-fold pyridoxal phosphate-dependent enzyme [Kurthia sibirica]PWI25202.1 N-acetyl-L,L-diaminopimelate aminotransferase [Kurthia sibirica]GEK35186.1 aminotransferase [Kurthia sibirica]